MREAERLPSRINSFQRSVRKLKVVENEQMDGEDILKYVNRCRKSLMGKCSRKMDNTFPKLLIPKLDSDRTDSSSSGSAEDHDNKNDSEVGNGNPSSSSLPCRNSPTPIELELEAEIKTEINVVIGGSVRMIDASQPPTLTEPTTINSLHVLEERIDGNAQLTDSSQTTHLDAGVAPGIEKNHCVNNNCSNDDTGGGGGTLPQKRTVRDIDQSSIIRSVAPRPPPPLLPLNHTKLAKTEGANDKGLEAPAPLSSSNDEMEEGRESSAFLNLDDNDDVVMAENENSELVEVEISALIKDKDIEPPEPSFALETSTSAVEDTPTQPQPELEISPKKINSDINGEPSVRKTSLRKTHPCQKCRMTFTSADKLIAHLNQQHDNSDSDRWTSSSSSSSNDEENYIDDDGKSGSLCLSSSSSSSSDDEDEDFEIDENSDESEAETSESEAKIDVTAPPVKSVPKTETSAISMSPPSSCETIGMTATNNSEIVDKPKKIKKKYNPPKKNAERSFPSRLKCPDCNILFEDVKSILAHRKNSDSCPCRASYDPKTSIRVEIFAEPDKKLSKKNMSCSGSADDDDEDSKFTKRVAVIDLPQEIFLCEEDFCDIAVYSSVDKEEHDKLHAPFQCNFCEFRPASALDLVEHELHHAKRANNADEKLKWLYCTRCELKFSPSHRHHRVYAHHFLNTHLCLSLNDPKCAICKTNKKHLRRHELGMHFKSHHDLSNITDPRDLVKCTAAPNCTAYFLTMQHLNDHLRLRHGIVNLPRDIPGEKNAVKHQCKDCEKSFFKLVDLRKHRLRKHIGWEEKIPCTFAKCKKVFESQKHLERHLRYSTDYHKSLEEKQVQSVQCPKCKKFINGRRPAYLRMHLEKHKEDRICEICGKVFKNNHHLNVHRLSHSGPESWEFMCSVCSKKCMTRPKLDEHMRTHTKAKPFVCEICGVKYAHRHNLRIHVNSKHGDQVEDKPRKFTKRNITSSRKGIKRKKLGSDEEEEEDDDTLTETDSD